MLLKINPDHPSEQKLQVAVQCLQEHGIVAFPTDTVYAFGGDLISNRAIERLVKLSGKKRPDFSFICADISQAMQYTATVDQGVFREMKRVFPGPYTFILKASPQVARLFGTNKKTVGIRIPANEIARSLALKLGHPLISTSLHDEDMILDYITDPREIQAVFRDRVNLVIDGGYGGNLPSTVVDFTGNEPVLVRSGAGPWN